MIGLMCKFAEEIVTGFVIVVGLGIVVLVNYLLDDGSQRCVTSYDDLSEKQKKIWDEMGK